MQQFHDFLLPLRFNGSHTVSGKNEVTPSRDKKRTIPFVLRPTIRIFDTIKQKHMKKRLFVALTCMIVMAAASAQTALKKVYDETINPITQIDQAVAKAKAEDKFVVCQVGGNWCPWCLRFADFATNDSTISRMIDDNFVYIHVNYNPRKSENDEKQQLTKRMLERLNNPARFGFPVFVVLDQEGKVLHIQDSSFLEEGQGYSQEKVLRFFKNWTPKAVRK